MKSEFLERIAIKIAPKNPGDKLEKKDNKKPPENPADKLKREDIFDEQR